MILLTGEEITQAYGYDNPNEVAKAQLKKVDKVVDDYFKKNAWMTRDGWKALLKETG